jgi:hypothetical protein
MKKILVCILLGCLVLAGCTTTIPTYNPPITVIQTSIITTTEPAIISTSSSSNVVALPVAVYPIPTDGDVSGIGRPLKQIELRTAWLSSRDLVAVESSPIYNGSDDNAVFAITYGIFEQRTDMIPAPAYFQNFIKTYSLVDVPGKSWVDVPIIFDIPQGTINLPSGTVYFNIAIRDTTNTGTIQYQSAERWEITFK